MSGTFKNRSQDDAEPVGKNDWQFKFLCHIYMGFDNKISSLPKLFLAYSLAANLLTTPTNPVDPLPFPLINGQTDIAPTLLALSYLGPHMPLQYPLRRRRRLRTALIRLSALKESIVPYLYRSRLSATVDAGNGGEI